MTRSTDTPIQFESAEYHVPASGSVCVACQQAIERPYYLVNGQTVCAACRSEIVLPGQGGTPVTRVVRAVGAGAIAGVAGALLYFAIVSLTGYELGLIAVAVGFAVGIAVKWGCYGRGGALYQAIAVLLTYLAIVSTYAPVLVESVRSAETEQAAAQPAVAERSLEGPASESATIGEGVVALIFLGALVMALPFLAGFQNIIGILIIGFGVYEAWKINKPPATQITGPHAVAGAAAVAAAVAP